MNIVLIGMRGSGKTEIGKKIAEILSYNFFDLDIELTAKLNKNIAQIVAKKGWPYFRQEESKTCELISQKNRAVIATGGGIVLNEKNIENLKRNGIVIFLNCDLKILKNRLKNDTKNQGNRPALLDTNSETELERTLEERKEKYLESADILFDVSDESLDRTNDIAAKANRIIALIKQKTTI